MKLFFTLVSLLLTTCSFGQVIRGKILEKSSGLPLPFANVFVNNTTQGVSSDENGVYELRGPFSGNIELVASYVGFVTEVKPLSFGSKSEYTVNFSLAENEGLLTEIELKSKRDKVWERELRKFETVFLALPDDPFKDQITLLNPWVLDFKKVKPDKEPGYLEATAQEPLLLVNEALGYDIEYHLQDFRMLRDAASFKGQFYYKKTMPADDATESQWIANRESIFSNSLRDLNLSILLEKEDSTRYAVYHALPEKMDRERTNDFTVEEGESIVPVDKNLFPKEVKSKEQIRILLPGRLEIHHLDKSWRNDYYTNVYHAISWLEAPLGYYDIDASGHLVDPVQVVLSGYLARQRMARSLPFDFEPGERPVLALAGPEVLETKSAKQNSLRERPWLTTNKQAFYPGEQVWLGGRMLYQDPNKADTLSRVLHVALVSEAGVPVSRSVFPIQNGQISGGFVLNPDLSPGAYTLFASTLWSQNFPSSDHASVSLILSKPGTLVYSPAEIHQEENPALSMNSSFVLSDQAAFRTLDLELDFKDEFGNPLDGDFVLSMTDAKSTAPLYLGTLESEMGWLDSLPSAEADLPVSFPIEYGISVRGKVSPENKKRSKSARITLIRGDLEDFGQVMSDSSGIFWASGLDFLDSATISIAALDERQKSIGSISLLPFDLPKYGPTPPKLDYLIKTSPTGYQDRLEEFMQLGEVTVSAISLTKEDSVAERYGPPTQSVSPEQLEILSMEQVLGLLRFNLTTLKFGNFTFQEQTGAPLLIIDGVSLPYLEKEEFREILLGFEPSQLKSIKAYSDNISKSQFGMAGYSGTLVIETKNGDRSLSQKEKGFDQKEFQSFKLGGFTSFVSFPANPDPEVYLKPRATVFWEPFAKTIEGKFKAQIRVPYGVDSVWIRAEGLTVDGEPFFYLQKISL